MKENSTQYFFVLICAPVLLPLLLLLLPQLIQLHLEQLHLARHGGDRGRRRHGGGEGDGLGARLHGSLQRPEPDVLRLGVEWGYID